MKHLRKYLASNKTLVVALVTAVGCLLGLESSLVASVSDAVFATF